jgi:hypothetical protein
MPGTREIRGMLSVRVLGDVRDPIRIDLTVADAGTNSAVSVDFGLVDSSSSAGAILRRISPERFGGGGANSCRHQAFQSFPECAIMYIMSS